MIDHRRLTAILAVWGLIAVIGLGALEAYTRQDRDYYMWSLRLETSNFFELDRVKLHNLKFYEQTRSLFAHWPIPPEFFKAESASPRYLFKPNLKMTIGDNDKWRGAQPGEEVVWSSNSWGFRGPEFTVGKPPGVIRIVALGASATGGVGVRDAETWPAFLQAELRRLFPDQAIEVINAGHNGQRSGELLDVLRTRVLPLDSDVLIYYEGANDLSANQFTEDFLSFRSHGTWSDRLARYSALFVSLRDGLGPDVPRPKDHTFAVSQDNPDLVGFKANLQDMAREARENNFKLVLSSFATVAQDGLQFSREEYPLLSYYLDEAYYPLTYGETAQIFQLSSSAAAEIATEEEVYYADVAPQVPKDVQYFIDHIHLRPEGNRLLAGAFASYLAEEVLPAFINEEQLVRSQR